MTVLSWTIQEDVSVSGLTGVELWIEKPVEQSSRRAVEPVSWPVGFLVPD